MSPLTINPRADLTARGSGADLKILRVLHGTGDDAALAESGSFHVKSVSAP
jgi:hypothetical protein